jgi:hypothetical protein
LSSMHRAWGLGWIESSVQEFMQRACEDRLSPQQQFGDSRKRPTMES